MAAGLAALAGFAASPVLAGRLARAGDLVRRCAMTPPALHDPDWAELLDAVTVQETRLFRHPDQCLAIAARLPALAAAAKREGRPLQLLSAGCATGEEAFTLAALARPHAPFEVVGLDLCRPALASAAEGRLTRGVGEPLELVPDPYRPWLAGAAGAAQPHPALRARTRFARANLLDGLGEHGSFDVILCRNVLIYLHDEARARVSEHLRLALRPGGILALGATDRAPAGLRSPDGLIWCSDGS